MNNIVFFDIDGTLMDVSRNLDEPSEKTKYALKELQNNGDLVFIASGRFKANLPKAILDLNPNGFILSNGAYIEYKGEVLYSKPFDLTIFNSIKKYCEDNDSLFTGEAQDYLYSPHLDEKFHNFLRKWKMEFTKSKDTCDDTFFYKCDVFFKNREIADNFEKQFSNVVDFRVQTADPEKLSYDINLFGINKGFGVDTVIQKLNIPRDNTYCFCDGSNDLELAKACKNSYAMGNGDESLKKIAYGVTDDVLDDGIYNKLVELKLIKAK